MEQFLNILPNSPLVAFTIILLVILTIPPLADFDLVILHSYRRRTVVGINVSNLTTELIQRLNCSVIIFGETS